MFRFRRVSGAAVKGSSRFSPWGNSYKLSVCPSSFPQCIMQRSDPTSGNNGKGQFII